MSNYTKITNFAAKDALTSGNASKIVKGTEIDNELNAIATAIATKVDLVVGGLQLGNGTVSAPSYSFSASTSTGVYSPGANQLALAVAGANGFQHIGTQFDLYVGSNTAIEHTGTQCKFYTNTGLGAQTLAGFFDTTQNLNLTNPLATTQGGTGAITAAAARTNLGVTATGADTTYAFRANNLSDLSNAATARGNLGLGALATLTTASNTNVSGGVLRSTKGSGVVTIQSGGSPTGGSDGDVFLIY